jgi:proteic killer suppression protein
MLRRRMATTARHLPVTATARNLGMPLSTMKDTIDRLRVSSTSVMLQATLIEVRIRSFVHKGLKRLYAEDNPKGLPPDAVDRIRKMMAFLQDMEDAGELRAIPAWKAHQMSGDRKGTWSLVVTRNWRLTFRVDAAENEILDLNYEDYH